MKEVALAVAMGVVVFLSARWYVDLPDVHRSMRTGACVRVVDPVHGHDCRTVPAWPHLTTWVP